MPGGDKPPVVVFDLDGTILGINSFPAWVLHLIFGRVPGLGMRRRMALSFASQWLLLRRKLRRMDHDALLWRLQAAWRPAAAIGAERFELRLLRYVRGNLRSVLGLVAESRGDAVLATAAAEDRAAGLARRLGFHHLLATPAGRTVGDPCNSGVQKRDRVVALLREKGWCDRPLVLFTDHIDDLPLIRESDFVFWYGTDSALTRVAAEAPDARFLSCRELDD